MMKMISRLSTVLFLSLTLLLPALNGCEQQGPAERAGESVDEATEDAGEAIEEAGEDMEDTAN
ncbi:hypothetical protein [Candidatus Nitrospira salsa]|nr:MAG: hypothetical protein NPIRA01_00140 [Nitrospirales bacterium]